MKEAVNESVFTLADDDYDEVEEEVVERDEEYDDEEGYDDEEYDEEEPYDDEEGYEDEESYDDGYQEGYDEGYDDQYYDDRLNRVLEEIADIKRGMTATPPAVIQQPPTPPVYPPQNPTAPYVYTNNATPNGGANGFSTEVVMYNEISRLRDELSKTQNAQSLHVELTRLKEDMEREQRAKEDRYQEEIRRLNEKIEALQKNELSPQSDNAGSEGVNGGVGIDRLLSINEAILMNAKDADARVNGELTAIKEKLAKMPDFEELSKSVAAIRRAAKNSDPALGEQVAKLKELLGSDGLGKIESKLSAMMQSLSGSNFDADELFRQVYEIKSALGSASEEENKRTAELLSLYDELAKAKFYLGSKTVPFIDKMQAVAEFCKKISTTEQTDLGGLVSSADELSATLAAIPVDKRLLEGLNDAISSGVVYLPRERYDAAMTVCDLAARATRESGGVLPDFLPELITAKNKATDGRSGEQNEKLQLEINAKVSQPETSAGDREKVRNDLKTIASLTIGEVIDIPRATAPRSYRAKTHSDGQAVFDKLEEIRQLLLGGAAAVQTATEATNGDNAETAASVAAVSEPVVTEAATVTDGRVAEAISALQTEIKNISVAAELDAAIGEIKSEYVKILDMLTGMTSRPAAPVKQSEYGDEVAQFTNNDISTQLYNVRDELLRKEQETVGLTQEYVDLKVQETVDKVDGARAATAEDLASIIKRLEEWDAFIAQIGDLRTEVMAVSETADVNEQLDKLYNDLLPQFDKLYDDLLAAVNALETNLGDRLNQTVTAAIAEINEGVSAINDTMASTAGSTTELFGAIGDLRTDFSEFSDKALAAQDASLLDRTKLLEDVAYIREQLEVQTVDDLGAEGVQSLRDRILDDLDALSSRLTDMETVLVGGEDGDTSLADRILTIGEQVKSIEETAANIFSGNIEFQTSVYDDLSFIKERLAPDENTDNIAEVLANAQAALEKLEALEQTTAADKAELLERLDDIKEQLHLKGLEPSISQVTETQEESGTLLSEIAEIRERLSSMESSNTAVTETVDDQLLAIERVTEKVNEMAEKADAAAADLGNISLIMDDIAELKAKLDGGEQPDAEGQAAMLSDLSTQIADVAARLEENTVDLQNLTLIAQDVEEIKARLTENETATTGENAEADEYDVMTEILSLREEVKAARIVDQNDVSNELEAVRTDILDRYNTLIDEIKSLRDELAVAPAATETSEATVVAPTSDELNLVLNEIVSLRDEVQAYKDEIAAYTAATVPEESETTETPAPSVDETSSIILDELTNLRAEFQGYIEENAEKQESAQPIAEDLESLKADVIELKDMVARRTTLVETEDGGASGELGVVLDEIINLKDELARVSDRLAEQETQSEIGDVGTQVTEAVKNALPDFEALRQDIEDLRNQVADIQLAQYTENEEVEDSDELVGIRDEIGALLEELRAAKDEAAQTESLRDEIAELKTAIENAAPIAAGSVDQAVLQELTALRQELSGASEVTALRDEIAELKSMLAVNEPDTSVMTEILSLREEIADLKSQLEKGGAPVGNAADDEIAALRADIAAWKESQSEEGQYGVMAEILALREEFQELKNGAGDARLNDSIETIKTDVASLRDEPDMGVMSEILALRDEFQAMKEQVRDAAIPQREQETKSNEELLGEVRSLRDQLFAISMANVNDGTNQTYESYNNIILDEITALRDELTAMKASDRTAVLADELADLKEKIAANDTSAIAEQLAKIKFDIASLQHMEATDASNAAILSALDELKTELDNQREADMTTLNFMAEMAQLLERQNQYINQNSNAALNDQIESLKAEIASTISAPSRQLADEIAALKEELSQNIGEPVVIDNQAILDELAAIKEEISKDNPTEESQMVLDAIARLKDEISALAEKDSSSEKDGDLASSISDLKNELTQIADLVTDEQKPVAKPAAKKPTAKKGGAKTQGAKSATKKPAAKKTPSSGEDAAELSVDEIISRIDSATREMPRGGDGDADFDAALNPDYTPSAEDDADMDVAARLAKQVADKLIMEQLVQQLGDANVPSEKVDEIVRDILPQEFNTIAVSEQSDRVRRLANMLVLDKLRARLTGKKPE